MNEAVLDRIEKDNNNELEQNFYLNENGLLCCMGCGTTFESETEAQNHLKFFDTNNR